MLLLVSSEGLPDLYTVQTLQIISHMKDKIMLFGVGHKVCFI